MPGLTPGPEGAPQEARFPGFERGEPAFDEDALRLSTLRLESSGYRLGDFALYMLYGASAYNVVLS